MIPNYDQEIERRGHPENFEPERDEEQEEEECFKGIFGAVAEVSTATNLPESGLRVTPKNLEELFSKTRRILTEKKYYDLQIIEHSDDFLKLVFHTSPEEINKKYEETRRPQLFNLYGIKITRDKNMIKGAVAIAQVEGGVITGILKYFLFNN